MSYKTTHIISSYQGKRDKRLRCINDKNLKLLQLALNYFQYVALVYWSETNYQKYRDLLDAEDSSFRSIKECLQGLLKTKREKSEFERRVELKAKLAKDSTWHDLNQPGLALQWREMESHAEFSTRALIMLATKALPAIENYRAFALLELHAKQRRIDKDTRYQLQRYLNALTEFVREQKQLLCQNMLARLQYAALRQDLTQGDIVYGMQQLLLAHEVKLPWQAFAETEPMALSQEAFCYFHKFILNHGTQQDMNALYRLPWLGNTNDFELRLHQNQPHAATNIGCVGHT